MDHYKKNIGILSEANEELAQLVDQVNITGLEFCETRAGQLNLCYSGEGTHRYFHSSYDAVKESENWVESLSLKETKVLYVYGVGLGYSFDALQVWLQGAPDRYLIYLEDDLRVIHRLMETARGGQLVSHRQVVLGYIGNNDEDCDALCEDLAYHFVKLPIHITALPHYERAHAERHQYIQMRVRHKTVHVGFASDEFLRHGVTFFTNYYKNLRFLPSSHSAAGLFGNFEGVPAIICGAGPSLNKNFSVLEGLDRRAILFAGGSAINALSGRGLLPHFGATVDPNHEQYKRMVTQTGYGVPFFYKGRTFTPALETIDGPLVYLAGNVGYPVSSWLEQKLGLDETMAKEGFNVLHLTIDIARQMGCNPIIFVGMDLAYSGMQLYADSVVADAKVSERDLTKATEVNNNSFLRQDINGEPVHTLWKWVAESVYTSRYAADHPETTFINATEGGLGAEGIPNMTLKEVADKYLSVESDLRGRIHNELEKARYHNIEENGLEEVIRELQLSLEQTEKLCEKLAKSFEDLGAALTRGDLSRVKKCAKDTEALQDKLSEEIAYQQIVSPTNHIRSVLFERRFLEIEGGEEKERILQQYRANRDEVLAQRQTAQVNLEIIRNRR